MTQPYRLMIAVSESAHLENWIKLALRLVAPRENGEILVRGMVAVPEGLSLSEGTTAVQKFRDALTLLARQYPMIGDKASVRVDYRPFERLLDELLSAPADLLLAQWEGPNALTGGVPTDDILQHAPCDVVLLGRAGWEAEGAVLLSLRGGPNITLGLQVAKSLADQAAVTLFHADEKAYPPSDLGRLARADPQITRVVTTMTAVSESLLKETSGHKAVVLGATFFQPQPSRSALGQAVHQLYERSTIPVALVRAFRPEAFTFHVPRFSLKAPEDVSTRVDRWFAENTFHSREFSDLHGLLALKEKQGVTISLGLPALNEEATVGKVITTMKNTLMDKIPLLDEIVLIDSNSTDNTVAIAESHGIPVYKHPEILPEVGTRRGKGEALWKSLHVLKGDIIAWIDTDVTNIHPRFVYGILGPLLKHPHIQYVKGFYQRPLQMDGEFQAYGGGRVTELVARPLINLFYPELSGLIQPLSGEYAGRRAALEQVPFFSGYGVETGLLIDLHELFGLDSIAQTDLKLRIHRNQSLISLSKMSFAILQVFIARLEKRHGIDLLDITNRSMKLVVHLPERFALDIHEISDSERPPMISLAPYRERFGKQVVMGQSLSR